MRGARLAPGVIFERSHGPSLSSRSRRTQFNLGSEFGLIVLPSLEVSTGGNGPIPEVSMRKTIRFALATAIVLGTAVAANARSVMKQCGEQWQAAEAAGTTNGETWPQFLAQCRAQLSSGAATAAPTPGSTTQPQTGSLFPWQTPAAPAPAASPAASNESVMKQCGAQWQAAKAAGTTSGATRPQFLKACRAQLASTTSAPPQADLREQRQRQLLRLRPRRHNRVHCFRGSGQQLRPLERRVDCRRICVAAGSSVSLSRINCRLGR